MITVVVVGEGLTEWTFVREVLAPPFLPRGIVLDPRLIETSPGSKGGAPAPSRVLRFLRETLLQRDGTYLTTFFDLYRLRGDFFGVQTAHGKADPLQRCRIIEAALTEALVKDSACRAERIFPHIQPFEFEALLFSDVSSFGVVEGAWHSYLDPLQRARDAAETPEHINDGPQTHPSARLKPLVPKYRKPFHGSRIAQSIGLARIRAECHHFNDWMTRIESLKPLR